MSNESGKSRAENEKFMNLKGLKKFSDGIKKTQEFLFISFFINAQNLLLLLRSSKLIFARQ